MNCDGRLVLNARPRGLGDESRGLLEPGHRAGVRLLFCFRAVGKLFPCVSTSPREGHLSAGILQRQRASSGLSSRWRESATARPATPSEAASIGLSTARVMVTHDLCSMPYKAPSEPLPDGQRIVAAPELLTDSSGEFTRRRAHAATLDAGIEIMAALQGNAGAAGGKEKIMVSVAVFWASVPPVITLFVAA